MVDVVELPLCDVMPCDDQDALTKCKCRSMLCMMLVFYVKAAAWLPGSWVCNNHRTSEFSWYDCSTLPYFVSAVFAMDDDVQQENVLP